jgi:hypothetical protein
VKFDSSFYAVSGLERTGSAFLGERHDAMRKGPQPNLDESIVGTITPQKEPGQVYLDMPIISTQYWFAGVWLSESGNLYVATEEKAVLRLPDAFRRGRNVDSFEKFPVPSLLGGVWGLSDDSVFTWGIRAVGKKQDYPVFRFDGKSWKEMPALEFEVQAMHGISPDCIWAVGKDSGVAVERLQVEAIPCPET